MFLSTWGNWKVTFFGFFLSAHHRQNGVRKMNSCKYCSNLNEVINSFSFLSGYYCCLSKAATSFTFTLLLVLSYHSYKGQQGPCSPRLSQKHSTGCHWSMCDPGVQLNAARQNQPHSWFYWGDKMEELTKKPPLYSRVKNLHKLGPLMAFHIGRRCVPSQYYSSASCIAQIIPRWSSGL